MIIDIKLKSGSSYHFEGVTSIDKGDAIIEFWWSKNEVIGNYRWDSDAFESFWIDDIEEFVVS